MNLIFNIFLSLGIIIHQGENENRKTYALITNDGVYEYCYKEEILNYFKTGEFKYDEELK